MNPAPPHVFDVDESNFELRVLQESMERPVLVDFWATWCGPCRSLGPLLEELADSYGGAFALGKVDVDANPVLAQQFRVQTIPVVFAIYQGRPVDQHVGSGGSNTHEGNRSASPRAELTAFIDKVLERCGVSPPTREATPLDPGDAEAHWRAVVEEQPENAEALLALGRLVLFRGQRAEAETLLGAIQPDALEYTARQSILALAGLLDGVDAGGGESVLRDRLTLNTSDPEAAYLVACANAARGMFAQALSVLVDQVATGAEEERVRAQEAARVVLAAAGRDDESVESERRRLSTLLF